MIRKIILGVVSLVCAVVIIITLAGIYKFNFTNDDVFVRNEAGKLVPIDG